jgi:hypothetical protein
MNTKLVAPQLGSNRSTFRPSKETRGYGRALHSGGPHRAAGATSLALQAALCASVAGRRRCGRLRADPSTRW